ncbi:MAG: hypothetical protein ACREKM_10255 [Longimicrobiales bacterium]
MRMNCLLALGAFTACEQPTSPSETSRPDAVVVSATSAVPTTSVVNCLPMAGSLGGDRTVQFVVTLSDGVTPADGAVVTAISPQFGPACWGATDADGLVALMGLKEGAVFIFSVRDEVSLDVPRLEIVPPDPLSGLAFEDDPTDAANRHAAMLLGGAACDDLRPLTWSSYEVLHAMPCVLTEDLDLGVELAATEAVTATVLGPSGNPLANVIVAAVSPATLSGTDLTTPCAKMPFRDQQECVNNSHGPAMLQAMNVTGSDGKVNLGVYIGVNDPIVFEAIFEQDGLTQFATIVSGEQMTVLLSPGMCDVETVVDASAPKKRPDVDILSTSSSVGMVARDVDPLRPGPELMPVPTALVVKLRVRVSGDGGDGQFALTYRTADATGAFKVRANFTVPAAPGECTVDAGMGSGVAAGAAFTGSCALVPGTTDEYILFFQTSGLSAAGVVEALYDIRTDGDHTDPARSGPQYERGAISITRLTPQVCPVQFNNDGRWNTA